MGALVALLLEGVVVGAASGDPRADSSDMREREEKELLPAATACKLHGIRLTLMVKHLKHYSETLSKKDTQERKNGIHYGKYISGK